MTPAEVIAMRDKLAEWLEVEKVEYPDAIAEALLVSGWVTNEPERKDDEN